MRSYWPPCWVLHTGAGEAFQSAAAAATEFENAAAAAGWVPGAEPGGGDAAGGRLHSYVKHALNRYLHAKRLRWGRVPMGVNWFCAAQQ